MAGPRNAAARELLETLTEQDIVELNELRVLYSRLNPELIALLQELREAEVKQLREGLELVRAVKMLGRVTKWIVLTFLGVFGSITLFGKTLAEFWALIRGIR